jgi:putative cardiolipin synthase
MTSWLFGCASLPPLDKRVASTHLSDTGGTRLGQAIVAAAAAHPGKSGIYPLQIPLDAYAARVALIRAAERTLDLQYYIWHGDTSGYLILDEVRQAAQRGVRVRMLLDDNGVGIPDAELAALDAHPNIEIRLFNPFLQRRFKALGYLVDFSRLNHRMHNKSLTVDTQATIVGGRNIGDEYLGANPLMAFSDLDVVAFGTAARDVSVEFDAYWNSQHAYPTASIVAAPGPDAAPMLDAKLAAHRTSAEATRFVDAVLRTDLVDKMLARRLDVEWAPVSVLYDPPEKAAGGDIEESSLLLHQMARHLGPPQRQYDLVSPYFVPGAAGTEALARDARRGVKMRIVTNSLAANDMGSVHSGYAKRRKALLEAGVRLYELKPDAALPAAPGATAPPKPESSKLSGSAMGSSSVALHAKTMVVDQSRVFIGSFNTDPRSYKLNTEMGLVIESPKLASAISQALDQRAEAAAYEVKLAGDGSLEWIEYTDQGVVRHNTEPKVGLGKRLGVGLLSLLPIEWLL